MGEPNVNYNSKSKRETIRRTEGEKESVAKREKEREEGKREKQRKTKGTRARRDGSGKERDEICLRAGGSPLCD